MENRDRAIVWFRSDLRVDDNPALRDACDSCGEVVGLFLIAGEQWREHDMADVHLHFMLGAARELSEHLATRNIPLLVREAPRFADAPSVVAGVAGEAGATHTLYSTSARASAPEAKGGQPTSSASRAGQCAGSGASAGARRGKRRTRTPSDTASETAPACVTARTVAKYVALGWRSSPPSFRRQRRPSAVRAAPKARWKGTTSAGRPSRGAVPSATS